MVDTLQGQLEEVRAELARVREEVVTVETRRLSAEAAKARAVTDYEHAAHLLGEAKREIEERTQIIVNLRGTIAEQEQSNRETITNYSATVERLLEEQAALRGENTIARERIEELQGSALTIQGEREGLQREVTLLREHIAHERVRYTELTAQLGQLSHMLSPQFTPTPTATTATDRVPALAVAGHRGG
jgi:chromosome segregation ATPase